ncbi:uncharacterized protein LOC133824666 [Humulus lupulus]|uniref:uncharacterized protein LOC133824666 n=1 Tax=Humulus lupulus TaxID=3486 RepID=UPI002B40B566|nr:uncharacterized protein LOC133824666 [Humulus lupulus]
MPRHSKRLREPREVEVHLDGDQLKASMKDSPPPKNVNASKEPGVHKDEREASSPAVPPDENHLRTVVAPMRDAGDFPPPRTPQVPNSGRQDLGPSTRRPDKNPRVHSREHPGKAKQLQGPEQKNNANPHNDTEVTSREAPPDLREKVNRRRSEVRTTPPVAPSKGREKGKVDPTDLRDSLNRR